MPEIESYNGLPPKLIRKMNELAKNYQRTVKIQEIVSKFTVQTKEATLKLCERGWYLDANLLMPMLRRSVGIDFDAPIKSIETSLARYYTENLDEIDSLIQARLENRYHLISPALQAHKKGGYALSIPALLAQADGVCKERLGYYLFIKKANKPQTHQYVEDSLPLLHKAIYLPLSDDFPISYSESKRDQKGYTGLNRHAVLHGESLDFATEENSLKAISLISFLANVLPPLTK